MFKECGTFPEDCVLVSYRHVLELVILMLMSYVGYKTVKRILVSSKVNFLRAGFTGVDLHRIGRTKIPEAQGVIAGTAFLIIMFLFIPVPFWKYLFGKDYFLPLFKKASTNYTVEEMIAVSHKQLVQYLAGVLSICCMIFLGFADDALHLHWRHKLLLPFIASLPLLTVYLANEGSTRMILPIPVRGLLGHSLDIGALYYVYMGLVAVFCTNTINIYAGINGLEVGQSIVVSVSIILFNLIELQGYLWRVHLFSLYFLIPFVAVCAALLKFNWYPAQLFVGDTFCCFAGMTFAVVGILGHFSKTLMLFFIPQWINFLLSLPQLIGLIPCPRHRVPHFSPDDGLLHASVLRFHPKSLSRPGQLCLFLCSFIKLVDCKSCSAFLNVERKHETNFAGFGPKGVEPKEPEEEVIEVTNFTLINLMLRILGPCEEPKATKRLLILQVLCSCLAFTIRYPVAWFFYGRPTSV